MIRKIEHIGIAVKDMEKAKEVYENLLDEEAYKVENVDSEAVDTVFFKTGDTKIELLSATREDSPIAKFITKKGEGMHHIAFDVDDIDAEIERLKEKGYQLLNEEPKSGADNKLIAFLHPKSSNGVLVELCQDKN
jgi:methylmalonyl-CoA/ethylmalonyl-CoA epimerase